MPAGISEEEVFDNDKDPMEAIREIRREEGVAEDELPGHPTDEIGDVQDHRDRQEEEENAQKDEEGEAPAAASDDSESAASLEDESPKEEEIKIDVDAVLEAARSGEDVDPDLLSEDPEVKAEAEDKILAAANAAANEADKESAKESEEVPVYKFRANNQDFEFSQEEVLAQFETVFGQAMNYTQKMQKIAPYRKMISALEQEGVSQDSLNLALDALKGDKGAIKQLLEKNKLDAYDLTSDEEGETAPYQPTNYGKDETSLEIEEITGRIQGDKEFAITSDVIDNQWDASSRQQIAANPNMITGLHNDIKSGLYDKVAPLAMKMKVLDGNVKKSDIEYYMLAGQQLAQTIEEETKLKDGQDKVTELNAKAQGAESEFDKASSEADRKRSASSTGARADRKGVIDYLDDNDEDFEAWYNKTMNAT